MDAVALTGARALSLIDVPEPEPAAGEVKLRVAYCGICGSDLHEYESEQPLRLAAMQPVMGHEFSGEVVAVGEGVTHVSPGQLAVVNPGSGCGDCYYCRRGREHLCHMGTGVGYTRQGAYAPVVVAPARGVVPLPEGADLREAALTEPFAVARHALIEAAYDPDELLVVAGAGPIGLLVLIAARQMGAQRIVVSEPLTGRRAAALECGATHAVEPQELPALTRSLSEGIGAAVSVDTSGLPAGIASCQDATMRGGRVVIAGVSTQDFPLNILRSIISEHRFIPVLGYTREEFAWSAGMIACREVDVSPVISEVVPVARTPEAFARLAAGRDALRKILVSPDA